MADRYRPLATDARPIVVPTLGGITAKAMDIGQDHASNQVAIFGYSGAPIRVR